MKLRISFFLSLVFAILLSSNAFAQYFEGMITMEIVSAKLEKAMTMVISTKGNNSLSEMETPMGNIKIYVDQSSGKMVSVMAAMKMGFEMDMKAARESLKNKSKDVAHPKVTATGEKKLINGHSCEQYHVISGSGGESNWWVTEDLPKSILHSLKAIYENAGKGMAGKNLGIGAEAIEEMFSKGLVPIRVEQIKDGKAETTITFIKYEQKNLDDAIFVIPSDINIQPMPAGMGSMGGR